MRPEDLTRPDYMAHLKRPAFRLVAGATPDALFARADSLKPRVYRRIGRE
jgi:hypothetical protein